MLNEELLKDVTRLLGAKTYSAAVNQSLEETIRVLKIRELAGFIGKEVWEGDLSQMRKDRNTKRPSNKKNRK